MSILSNYFMMKYDFYQETIPIYSKVNYITCINSACLVENVDTKKRVWVMKSDIYPLCKVEDLNITGDWSYSDIFHKIAIEYNYL